METTDVAPTGLRSGKLLWLALVTVLGASAVHVAGTFSTLEPGGALPILARLGPYTGVLAAIALDLGLIGLAWGIGARKRARPDETPWGLWGGVGLFAVLSALANFDHALTVLGNGSTGAAAWVVLDQYTRVKVVALSATLPLLTVYLTRVVETAAASVLGMPGEATASAGDALWMINSTVKGLVARGVLSPEPALSPDAASTAHANGRAPNVPTTVPRPRSSSLRLTPERYQELTAEHVPPGTGAQEADRIVAGVAGCSAKTVQRARLGAGDAPSVS